jgi:hypothetical protein
LVLSPLTPKSQKPQDERPDPTWHLSPLSSDGLSLMTIRA